jgi:hypothetical protein
MSSKCYLLVGLMQFELLNFLILYTQRYYTLQVELQVKSIRNSDFFKLPPYHVARYTPAIFDRTTRIFADEDDTTRPPKLRH